ncbi:MAG: protein translocase subunit SecD [Micrococcales bacterium]
MSVSGVTKAARKRLIWLGALILSIAGLVGAGVATGSGASLTPKLALDLEGGTQIILSPLVAEGQKITEQQLQQAVGIIRQRVDSTGVSEAQITTSGSNNIVVSIPGTPDDNTLKLIRNSAKLEFRPVILASSGASASVGGNGASASAKPSVVAQPTDASDTNWVTSAIQSQFDALDCTKQFRTPGQIDDPTKPLVTCDSNGYSKYVLGPVEISGEDIKNASNGTTTTSTGASTNTWAVNLSFNDAGAKKFSAVTSRLYPLTDPRNRFAVTLDGYVITAPTTNAVITNGDAQITGNFDQGSSKSLADSLKYGSLPISFQVQSQENISATLGSEQLASGLLAGIIGLLLVVIYSFFQYRGLALVTVGSLLIAAILTYVVIVFLSWRNGFRLSLSGVAGLIVAIGITADSFIVYFERVRDELRDGRPLNAAVEAGWKRALRTILVSDGVSLLAAVTLFVLTVGSVKGFAFTLGLTTLIDVAVVMLFTHPMLQLLAQTRFFSSGHPWSGFDSQNLGASYRGRLEFKPSERVSATKKAKASKEAAKRQTLAERKAAAENEGSN